MRRKIIILLLGIILLSGNYIIYASNNQKIDYLITKCMQFIMLDQLDQLKYLIDDTDKILYKKNIKFFKDIFNKGEIVDFSIKKLSKSGNEFVAIVEIKFISSSNKRINSDYVFIINSRYKIKDINKFNKNLKPLKRIIYKEHRDKERIPVTPSKNGNKNTKLTQHKGFISLYPYINNFINMDTKQIDFTKKQISYVGYSRDKGEIAMLIKFKLPSKLIKKAILHLNLDSYEGGSRVKLGIYRITNNLKDLRFGTFNAKSLNKIVVKYSTECYARFIPKTSSGSIDIDVTDLILSWISGEKNYGMIVKPISYGTYRSFYFFHTMYSSKKNLRPRLDLYFCKNEMSKTTLDMTSSVFRIFLIKNLKPCREISHMQDKLTIKVKYLGNNQKSAYLLINNKGLGVGVYKIPIYFSGEGEKYYYINAPLNGFRPGSYELIIYDLNKNKLANYEFKIR
ncbi:DNRLRE domain-containing protein [Desulfothermus sp.]